MCLVIERRKRRECVIKEVSYYNNAIKRIRRVGRIYKRIRIV